jgi:hypothetical protein
MYDVESGYWETSDRFSVFRKNMKTRLPQFPPAAYLAMLAIGWVMIKA